MLDDLAATIENLGPRFEALDHAIEHGLVFEAGNRAHVVRPSRAQRTIAAGFRVAVVDLFEIAQPAAADRRQQLAGGADVGAALSVVSELVLAEEALAHEEPRCGCCGLGTCGMQPAFSQASMSSILK